MSGGSWACQSSLAERYRVGLCTAICSCPHALRTRTSPLRRMWRHSAGEQHCKLTTFRARIGSVNDEQNLLDSLFHQAVSAIDAGDVTTLERLLTEHPRLVRERLETPGHWLRDKVGRALDGFFQRPYLLWFVAEDPVRIGKLPGNIAQVTRTILQAAERERVESLREQLNYALRLVGWSWIAAQCGVQIELLDVLIDAGASPDGVPEDALVNGNFAAAQHLIKRGARMTLPAALCLGHWEDARRLADTANAREKQMSFVLAALKGKVEALRFMIDRGVDVNEVSPDLYSHATPLHHAVCSGSLDGVQTLVEAGAALDTKDTVHVATPLGWAEYYQGEKKGRYAEIAAYLREKGG